MASRSKRSVNTADTMVPGHGRCTVLALWASISDLYLPAAVMSMAQERISSQRDSLEMGSRVLAGFAGNSGQMVCTPSMSSTFELFALWFLQHWRQL